MSRIGNKVIGIPAGVNVTLVEGQVLVKGPKGNLRVDVHPEMTIKLDGDKLAVERPSDSRKHRSLHGTTRMLVANAITGVSTGFEKELRIIGIGYQAQIKEGLLLLQLGYSHDIYFEPPTGIEIEAKRTEIKISGIDKQLVGEVASKIRSLRKPEPYKGKGVRYLNEYVRSKQGKTVGGGS